MNLTLEEIKDIKDALYWQAKCKALESDSQPGLVRSLRSCLRTCKRLAEEAQAQDGEELADSLKSIICHANIGLDVIKFEEKKDEAK